jgi:hypothetical protein
MKKAYLIRKKKDLLIAVVIYLVMIGAGVIALMTDTQWIFRTAVITEWVLMVPAMWLIFRKRTW